VRIQLTTHLEQDGQTEDHAFDEPGQLIRMDETTYLRYEEIDPETTAKTPVTLKIQKDGGIILTRGQGQMRLQLHFYLDQETDAVYSTPYGQIPILTRTTRVKVETQDQPVAGKIDVDYQLFTGQEQLGKYQLRLIFQQ